MYIGRYIKHVKKCVIADIAKVHTVMARTSKKKKEKLNIIHILRKIYEHEKETINYKESVCITCMYKTSEQRCTPCSRTT